MRDVQLLKCKFRENDRCSDVRCSTLGANSAKMNDVPMRDVQLLECKFTENDRCSDAGCSTLEVLIQRKWPMCRCAMFNSWSASSGKMTDVPMRDVQLLEWKFKENLVTIYAEFVRTPRGCPFENEYFVLSEFFQIFIPEGSKVIQGWKWIFFTLRILSNFFDWQLRRKYYSSYKNFKLKTYDL